MSRRLLLLLSRATLAQSYTTFETTCSAPTTSVNYVSSPDIRGTMDILWSCLFTIIACTWTIQHLNVPEQREGRDAGWQGDIKWQLKRAWTSGKWMLATMVAPEILLAKACGDLSDAKLNLNELQEFAVLDEVPWTLVHSLYANMGGFVIRSNIGSGGGMRDQNDAGTQTLPDNLDSTRQQDMIESAAGREDQITPKPTSYSLSRDIRSNEIVPESNLDIENLEIKSAASPPQTKKLTHHNPYHLTADSVLILRKAGILHKLPYLTVEDINDKSKSDTFVRAIAVIQIAWTLVQIIARAVRHLAISQLEIAVTAFALCAIIIYCLNWEKPKGVQVSSNLLQYQKDIPKETLEALKAEDREESVITKWLEVALFSWRDGKQLGSPISNIFNRQKSNFGNMTGFFIGAVVFGGLHVTAWNFVFPSRVEHTLWWISSIWCTIYVLVTLLLVLVAILGNWLDFHPDAPAFILVCLCLFNIFYILSRLFLLVEVFRILCFLPPTAYVATWALNIPHVT
jgi:hypothetical protein